MLVEQNNILVIDGKRLLEFRVGDEGISQSLKSA